MSDPHELIASWLRSANRIVAFTGAGISTESGIPDFRSPGGIWANSTPVQFDDFLASESARYEYWRQKAVSQRDISAGRPNVGHRILAKWETQGRLQCVITQNIDGLHQLAGSRDVIQLHGNARAVGCLDCGARFDAEEMVEKFLADDQVPPCPRCVTGRLKHATISFGQSLDMEDLNRAFALASDCDVLLAMGSSLVVEPAASIPRLARRDSGRLVIINRDPTPQDRIADAVVHGPIGATLRAIDEALSRDCLV